jgi:hypothetical protein
MALVELKSNLANFRSSFTTTPLEDTVNNGSQLNIDTIPKSYNRRTAWTNARVERSELNRDSDNILKYTGRTKFLPKYVALSKFNIDSTLSKFSPTGKYAPSKYANEKAIPSTTTRWIGSTAPAVNYFDNKKSGASGFEIKATDKNKSGFTGVDNVSNTYNYPTNVVGVHGSTVASLPLTNTKYPIDGIASLGTQLGNGSKFYYLSDNIRTSKTFSEGGYYDKKKYGDTVKPNSSVLGAKASAPPSAIDSTLSNLPLLNAKYPIDGFASLTNQLGIGSKFYYISDNARVDKLFSLGGYNEKRKYSDLVKLNTSALKTKALDSKSSPSAIEEQYKKLNLRDDPHNIYNTYIQQPYVLRGIQREDKKEPQLWGIGRFDDGLIRGGATTAVERAALDTVRIAKWLASPKGLLWVVKQVGLGLTNPKVETIAGDNPLARQTRIHTGVASLLSVAGSAFGLHITRHGIPFANEAASYGAVQLAKGVTYKLNSNSNRLISLKGELFKTSTITLNDAFKILDASKASDRKFVSTVVKGFAGLSMEELSGNAGPQSVYGIGATPIRRAVDSVTDAVNNAKDSKFATSFNSKTLYAGVERAKTNNTYDVSIDDKKRDIAKVDTENSLRTRLENLQSNSSTKDDTPGAGNNVQLQTNKTLVTSIPGKPDNLINQYEVLAYNRIPKKVDLKSFNDFRNSLSDDSNAFSGKITSANTDALSYENNNLENKKGFGQQGKVGADRSNPLEFFAPSKNYGRDVSRRPWAANIDKFRGDKITALDIVQSNTALTPAQVYSDERDQIEFYFEDGDQGTNVMVFRCTMTGFSDSFSPGWNRIDIMGRPDGAYLYSSFERQVSFTFTAAATSRTEMIPMWRKLNYLASYTMPDFRVGGRPSGPFMRLTIGNLFKNTPGFINSLSYTIPDEATWDVDANNRDGEGKQLPNIVEVSVGFTVIADFRPQVMGRAYSMFAGKTGDDYDWLWDATINSAMAAEAQKKYEEEVKKLNEELKANTTTKTTDEVTEPAPAPAPQLTEPGDVSVPNEPVNLA